MFPLIERAALRKLEWYWTCPWTWLSETIGAIRLIFVIDHHAAVARQNIDFFFFKYPRNEGQHDSKIDAQSICTAYRI